MGREGEGKGREGKRREGKGREARGRETGLIAPLFSEIVLRWHARDVSLGGNF